MIMNLKLTVEDLVRDLDPVLKDWLFHSNDARAEAWRTWIKETKVSEMTEARKRQEMIHEHVLKAGDNDPKALVRRKAIIDPVIADDMRERYGKGCFNDPDFLKDTKKKAPELFVPDA